jgi:hypothetical protein
MRNVLTLKETMLLKTVDTVLLCATYLFPQSLKWTFLFWTNSSFSQLVIYSKSLGPSPPEGQVAWHRRSERPRLDPSSSEQVVQYLLASDALPVSPP